MQKRRAPTPGGESFADLQPRPDQVCRAVLSAAGRHLAAHLDGLCFVEGSYGTHLLVEDIAEQDVTFGYGGKAPALTGPGLGVSVREDLLAKYGDRVASIG